MSNVKRVTVEKYAIIPASAEGLWEIVADWGGLMKWFPKGEPGSNVTECKLLGDDKSLPLTRVLVLDNGGEVAETLILQDDQRRRIRYYIGDGAFPGIFNYSGSQTVDSEGASSAKLTLTTTFDLDAPDADPDMVRSQFEAMFEHVIFAGLTAHFTSQ